MRFINYLKMIQNKRKINHLPLFQVIMSTLPIHIKLKQIKRFSIIHSNFEFSTWVSKNKIEKLALDAMNRGFEVWGNVDSYSAFLYGAGYIIQNDKINTIKWLKKITGKGKSGQILLKLPNTQYQLIEIFSEQEISIQA